MKKKKDPSLEQQQNGGIGRFLNSFKLIIGVAIPEACCKHHATVFYVSLTHVQGSLLLNTKIFSNANLIC